MLADNINTVIFVWPKSNMKNKTKQKQSTTTKLPTAA